MIFYVNSIKHPYFILVYVSVSRNQLLILNLLHSTCSLLTATLNHWSLRSSAFINGTFCPESGLRGGSGQHRKDDCDAGKFYHVKKRQTVPTQYTVLLIFHYRHWKKQTKKLLKSGITLKRIGRVWFGNVRSLHERLWNWEKNKWSNLWRTIERFPKWMGKY